MLIVEIPGNTTTTGGQEALTKELNKEKHVVKDGCLVAVQQIDKGQVHGVLVGLSISLFLWNL
jgi:hypothetical protein